MNIDGRKSYALIDTGAGCNLIRHGFSENSVTPSSPSDFINIAATGYSLPVRGTQTISFSLQGHSFTCKCLVIDNLREELILGNPWLQQEEANIDLSRQCIHIGRESRVTAHWHKPRAQPVPQPCVQLETALKNVPDNHHDAYHQLFQEFAPVFDSSPRMTTTRTVKHAIRLKKDVPFRLRPYHCSNEKKQIIYEQTEELLANGLIEPSNSDYCSPIVIVRKKDGTPRYCIDYRRLNELTQDEAAPLPIIHETLKDLGKAKVFTTLDLKSGYWQLPMEESSKKYTAFATPDGATYQWRVMAFGLKNAPSTFQRFMAQEVLATFLGKFAMVYLDDIVIYSNTHKEHLVHLRRVLERLQLHGLRCATSKCQISTPEIEYLGHTITADGNQPQQRHLHQIQVATPPRTRKQLRSFLGLCNWLREYIPEFAAIATPLTDLLSQKTRWKWTEAAEEAFHKLKKALANPTPLSRPDPTRPFVLQTDASAQGMGCVLYQEQQNGVRNVVSYASARFRPHERRYDVNEQECLALIWGVKTFRAYLEDKPFKLRTDNKTITWLNKMKESKTKLARWALLLQQYNFQLEHCPGVTNELPDLLSRNPDNVTAGADLENCEKLLPPQQANTVENPASIPAVVCQLEVRTLADEVRQAQQHDQEVQRKITLWNDLHNQDAIHPWQEAFLMVFHVHEGTFYRREDDGDRIIVPEAIRPRVLFEYHDSRLAGHPGAEETTRAIAAQYYWPTLKSDVATYVHECLLCAQYKRKPPHPAAPQRPRQPERPWETIACDLMGPYEETSVGHRFILVVTDLFSRWVEAFPMVNTETEPIVRLLEREVFHRWGYPKSMITDNGPQFTSSRFARFCSHWQVLHWTTPIYHARANPTERRNQELKKGLRLRLHNKNANQWDEQLSITLFSLRRRRNAATGQTPSHLLFGHDLQHPGAWAGPEPPHNQPEVRQQSARVHQTRYINRRRQPPRAEPNFAVGDRVLVQEFVQQPFGVRWNGPHQIQQRAGPTTFWVLKGRQRIKVHADNLRPAPPRRQRN